MPRITDTGLLETRSDSEKARRTVWHYGKRYKHISTRESGGPYAFCHYYNEDYTYSEGL